MRRERGVPEYLALLQTDQDRALADRADHRLGVLLHVKHLHHWLCDDEFMGYPTAELSTMMICSRHLKRVSTKPT